MNLKKTSGLAIWQLREREYTGNERMPCTIHEQGPGMWACSTKMVSSASKERWYCNHYFAIPVIGRR